MDTNSSRCHYRIHYSDRYSDDFYEYRHVILPKPLFKMIPKEFFNPDNTGTLRLLDENEWRGIGITQSLGWEHYEVHGEWRQATLATRTNSTVLFVLAPEPHVLLFRRAKNFDEEVRRKEALQAQMQQANKGKAPARRLAKGEGLH